MSYDPSHRKPPRQERWPQATPPTGWPSYRDDGAYPDAEQADSRYAADRQGIYRATAGYPGHAGYQDAPGGPGDRGYQSAVITDTFPPEMNGYGSSAGFGPADGFDARDAYGSNGFGGAGNGNGNGTGNGGGYGAGSSYVGTVGGYPNAADGYADAGDSFVGGADRYSRTESGYGAATDEYAGDADGYGWNENGYDGAAYGYAGTTDTFAGTADTFAGAADGYAEVPDGYADPDFAGSPAYLGPGSYTEPGFSDSMLADPMLADPMLVAPDTGVDPYRWQAEQDLRREAARRGLGVGAVTGFLAAAVAIGVSTLVAGFIRPQASPMAALDSVFIDRTPAVLRNAAVHHFGAHGRTMLLLGMYAAIAVLAVGIGLLARRAAAPGVASLAAVSLLAAFVTITRPGGHVSDVTPAIIGGIAGVAALLWLMQASVPPQRVPPVRQTRGNDRGGA